MGEYDQPFCVIGSVGHFPHARDGYLPPLIPPNHEEVDDPFILWEIPDERKARKSGVNLQREIALLKGRMSAIENYLQQKQERRRSKRDAY